MSDRQPIYRKDNQSIRLISAPNGLWQLQEHIGRPKDADPRTVPNWRDRGPAMERDAAIARLNVAAVS